MDESDTAAGSQAVTGDQADTADIEDNEEPDLDDIVGAANAGRESDVSSNSP